MASIQHRMNKLRQTILDLRCGPGAAKLPPNVTRLHLSFSYGLSGHMGPRKFAREQLPRLKFWNPSIPMIVNRGPNTKNSAVMTIYMTKESDSDTKGRKRDAVFPLHPTPGNPSQRLRPTSWEKKSPAPSPAPNEKIVRVGMFGKRSGDILHEFLAATGAQIITPTPGEQHEIEHFKELNAKAEKDREISKIKLAKEREKAAIMKRLAAKVAESSATSGL